MSPTWLFVAVALLGGCEGSGDRVPGAVPIGEREVRLRGALPALAATARRGRARIVPARHAVASEGAAKTVAAGAAETNSARTAPSPVEAGASGAGPSAASACFDSSAPLEQTDAAPAESAGFRARMQLIVEALRTGNPASASCAFYPRAAYEKVKAKADPGRDWDHRLYAAFERDLLDYRKRLGPNPERATLVEVRIDARAVRLLKPGAEGNRIPYHRVVWSTLRVRDAAGNVHDFDIASMIAWRGEWYVIHLGSFG